MVQVLHKLPQLKLLVVLAQVFLAVVFKFMAVQVERRVLVEHSTFKVVQVVVHQVPVVMLTSKAEPQLVE